MQMSTLFLALVKSTLRNNLLSVGLDVHCLFNATVLNLPPLSLLRSCPRRSLRTASSSTGGRADPCSCGTARRATSGDPRSRWRARSSSQSATLASASLPRTACRSASSACSCRSPCSRQRWGADWRWTQHLHLLTQVECENPIVLWHRMLIGGIDTTTSSAPLYNLLTCPVSAGEHPGVGAGAPAHRGDAVHRALHPARLDSQHPVRALRECDGARQDVGGCHRWAEKSFGCMRDFALICIVLFMALMQPAQRKQVLPSSGKLKQTVQTTLNQIDSDLSQWR